MCETERRREKLMRQLTMGQKIEGQYSTCTRVCVPYLEIL